MRLSFPSLPSVNQSFSIAGRNWKWTGSRWNVDSITIKSPYQLAVEAGFQGTEQQWIDSLNPATVAASAAQTAMASLTHQAPETLDTFAELAAALGDDPNFATTITSQMSSMSTQISAMPDFTVSTSSPSSQDGTDGDIWIVVS